MFCFSVFAQEELSIDVIQPSLYLTITEAYLVDDDKAVIIGNYSHRDRSFLFKGSKIKLSPQGDFKFKINFKQNKLRVKFSSTAEGVQDEGIYLLKRKSSERLNVQLGVQTSYLHYEDARVRNHSYINAGLRLIGKYSFLPSWSGRGDLQYDRSIKKSGEGDIDLYQANLLANFRQNSHWEYDLGLSYLKMVESLNDFGFSDVSGPAAGITYRKTLRKERSWESRILASVFQSDFGTGFDGTKFLAGLTYNQKKYGYFFELSTMNIVINDISIQQKLTQIGMLYRF